LQLSEDQQKIYKKDKIDQIFPEYFLIKVNNFDNMAKDTLDEWVYFLKNGEIKDNFKAKGLMKAKKSLDILKLSEQERRAYEKYQDDLHYQASMFESSYTVGFMKGEVKGEKRGRKRGRKEKAIEIAGNLLGTGALDAKSIADMTGLIAEEIEVLK